ncbi:DUF982 domain-containing protein [Rhodobacter sp. NTK016B]|nr:DUF982 domain-containing protein [Rhodobacter sp. NTK016B]
MFAKAVGRYLKEEELIEIYWGDPVSLVSKAGECQSFSTFEKAQYWLQRKWPADDETRRAALGAIDAAMDCLMPAKSARRAFVTAAIAAGYRVSDVEPAPLLRAA